jgi:hypothetical protein
MNLKQLLTEQLFGNTATVYHNGENGFDDYLKTGSYKSGLSSY